MSARDSNRVPLVQVTGARQLSAATPFEPFVWEVSEVIHRGWHWDQGRGRGPWGAEVEGTATRTTLHLGFSRPFPRGFVCRTMRLQVPLEAVEGGVVLSVQMQTVGAGNGGDDGDVAAPRGTKLTPICEWLDRSTANASSAGTWTTAGCSSRIHRTNHLQCTCTHLTEFRAVMRYMPQPNLFDPSDFWDVRTPLVLLVVPLWTLAGLGCLYGHWWDCNRRKDFVAKYHVFMVPSDSPNFCKVSTPFLHPVCPLQTLPSG